MYLLPCRAAGIRARAATSMASALYGSQSLHGGFQLYGDPSTAAAAAAAAMAYHPGHVNHGAAVDVGSFFIGLAPMLHGVDRTVNVCAGYAVPPLPPAAFPSINTYLHSDAELAAAAAAAAAAAVAAGGVGTGMPFPAPGIAGPQGLAPTSFLPASTAAAAPPGTIAAMDLTGMMLAANLVALPHAGLDLVSMLAATTCGAAPAHAGPVQQSSSPAPPAGSSPYTYATDGATPADGAPSQGLGAFAQDADVDVAAQEHRPSSSAASSRSRSTSGSGAASPLPSAMQRQSSASISQDSRVPAASGSADSSEGVHQESVVHDGAIDGASGSHSGPRSR